MNGIYQLSLVASIFYIYYVTSFYDSKIKKNIKNKKSNLFGIFLSMLIGPLIFGFIDNFGMMIGVDAIENLVVFKNLPDVVKSMIGNTFSDAIGAFLGASISSMMKSYTAYDDSDVPHWSRTLGELIGIVLGCLIPIAFYYSSKGSGASKSITVSFVIFMILLLVFMILNHEFGILDFAKKDKDVE